MQAVRKGSDSDNTGQIKVRRRVDPRSPPTTIELRGVKVHFPFKPYACQESYMEKVMDALFRSENALLESPTGTGKTLCLLCATLAWQREQARTIHQGSSELPSLSQSTTISSTAAAAATTTPRKVPTIIYASRTHSQLKQVIRELKSTRYRPQHAILASRDQMCVNPKVKTAHATASDINHNCNRLCKDRKCRYRNDLETFSTPQNESETGDDRGTQPIMDMEELVEMGQQRKVCPFYYTRSLAQKAELILVPYNYLFDKDARTSTLSEVPWDNAVIIFDEAHNLESFASDSASFDLSSTDIAGCIAEVQKAVNYLQAMPDVNLKLDNMLKMKFIFLQLEKHLLELGSQTAYRGEFLMEFFRQGGITHANHVLLIEEVRKVNDFIMDMRGTGAVRGSPRLEHFVSCLKRVYGHSMESRCLAKAAFYRAHVSPKDIKTGARVISYWCFAPALAMEELASLNVRSILVTSGTLSPLASYALELGIPFQHRLENPHIIQNDQIHVRVIGKGVSGKDLTSSYDRRQDNDYYAELGNTLVSLARIVPAGMLIFFPSYGVMEACLQSWGGPNYSTRNNQQNDQSKNFFAVRRKQQSTCTQFAFPQIPSFFYKSESGNTPWTRMLSIKSIVVEPKASSELPDALKEFQRLLNIPNSKGCILMGVCRGKISEGIDFSNEMSRAVVITGLPFPPAFDPKVKLKRDFLDGARASSNHKVIGEGGFGISKEQSASDEKLSGDEWYVQQAHRAVNQAIGRVIRNRSDYGAVLLLDSRFGQPRNKSGLSKWLRPHIQNDEGFGVAIKSLVQFYKVAEECDQKRKEEEKHNLRLALAAIKANEALEIKEDNDDIAKVAIVRNADLKCSASATFQDSYIPPEQVVARVDIRDFERQSHGELQIVPNTREKESMSGRYSRFDEIFQSSHANDPSFPRPAIDSKEVAALFMSRMKAIIPQVDQSIIFKGIVAMKNAGNANDVGTYLKFARSVLSVVCKYELLESSKVPHHEQLLFLFLRVNSKQHREKVELVAMQEVFQSSTLLKLCKGKLNEIQLGRLQTAMVSLLQSLWCAGSMRDSLSVKDYLNKAGVAINIVVSGGNGAFREEATQALVKLVPERYRSTTFAAIDEQVARDMANKLKQQERKFIGEETIDEHRFKSTLAIIATMQNVGDQKLASQDKAPNGARLSESSSKRPLSTDGTQGPMSINPYMRKRATVNTRSDSSSREATTSLTNYLQVLESETYVKQSTDERRKAISSNAPENLVCPMCDDRCTEPFVAECGHVACLSCWLGWFQRSETCPTCRRSTSRNTLAQAVFQPSEQSLKRRKSC